MVAVLLEFRPTNSVLHPFTAQVIEAGSPLEVEWRKVPEGLFPAPDLAGAVATHVLAAGEPVAPSDVTAAGSLPSGWWQLALEVSFALVPGADVQIVLIESPRTVPAVVVRMGAAVSPQGPVARVALPARDAPPVAPAEGFDGPPGPPQVDRGHGERPPGQRLGRAVVVAEHLGGAGRGKLQGLALGVLAGLLALVGSQGVGVGCEG